MGGPRPGRQGRREGRAATPWHAAGSPAAESAAIVMESAERAACASDR
jgi:hypothetical protein